MMVPGVIISRDTHTVAAAGESIERVDIEMETSLPGNPEFTRSTKDSLLGELDSFIHLIYNVEVNRERPLHEDPFPPEMPNTICNASLHGREDRTEGNTPELPLEYIFMDHLHVQEAARGMGYGQLMWDCYLALVAYGDYDAHGKVGDDENRTTVGYLKSQGVPEADITESDSAAWMGENRAVWKTDGSNVTSVAPIEEQQFEV